MFGSRTRAYILTPPTTAGCVRYTTQTSERSDFKKGTGVMPNRDHPKFECTRLIPSSDTTIVSFVRMSHTLFLGKARWSGNKSLWNSFKGPGGEVNILDALRPTNDYKCLALDNFPPHNKSSSTPMALTSASIKRIWISIPYPLGENERRKRKAKRAYLMHETANKTPTMSHKSGKTIFPFTSLSPRLMCQRKILFLKECEATHFDDEFKVLGNSGVSSFSRGQKKSINNAVCGAENVPRNKFLSFATSSREFLVNQ